MDYYPRYSQRPASSKSGSSYYGREVDHHAPPSIFHDYRPDYDDYWRNNRDRRCDYDDYNRNYRNYSQDYDATAYYNWRNYRSQSPNHRLRRRSGHSNDYSSLAPRSSSRGSDRINRRYKPYQSPPSRIRRPNPSREYERPPRPQQWGIDRNEERPRRYNQTPLDYNRDGGEYQSLEAQSRRKYNRPPPRYDDHQRREAHHPRYNNRPPRYDDHQRREAHHPRYNNRPPRCDSGKQNHRSAAANHRSSQPPPPPPPPPSRESVFLNTDYSDRSRSPSPGSPALSSPCYDADAPRSCSPVMELSPDNAALSEFFNASFDTDSQSSCDDGRALWM